jgi:hypothetical protein
MAAYTRCLRCAGAPRRPASGSELSLLIPSWHAVLSDPGESDIDIFQKLRCRHWPSPNDHRLGTPDTPAIRSTRAVDFAASLVRFRYSLPGCLPPCTDQTGILHQPPGTFTSRLSTDRSPSPLLDITTTATGLLVWRFFCQEVSAERPIFLPSLVSLFDLKARFFIPTRHSGKPSRAGAVKAGRLFGDHPQGLALKVPSTAAPSNAVGWVSKMTIRGEPAFERGSIAPQPCIRWVQGPEP